MTGACGTSHDLTLSLMKDTSQDLTPPSDPTLSYIWLDWLVGPFHGIFALPIVRLLRKSFH